MLLGVPTPLPRGRGWYSGPSPITIRPGKSGGFRRAGEDPCPLQIRYSYRITPATLVTIPIPCWSSEAR